MLQLGNDPYGNAANWQQPVETSGFDATLVWSVVLTALGVGVALLVFFALARSLLRIAKPSTALVIAGKNTRRSDGTQVQYQVLQQGQRGWAFPILHQVSEVDMRLIPVEIIVQNAYSLGNIPLQIHAVANVKISSTERLMSNAIERFLGKPLFQIQAVAQQTLEGAVREVIAGLTPEQVNEDRLSFAEKLTEAAVDDLEKLGLQMDTLKIQNVSDDTGYLDSLGRPQIAAVLRDAENAENIAAQEVTHAQAVAQQREEVAKASAETLVIQEQNRLREIKAQLEGEALAVEREALAAAKTARAEAERELQALRQNLEHKRLQADVVIPAQVQREAEAILAVGQAAPTAETGAAAVQVLEMMGSAWRSMGAHARELYVIQHLEEIIGTVVDQLQDVEIREVNVLDQGDGSALASYAATYPHMVARVLATLSETTGVNVPAILAGKDGR